MLWGFSKKIYNDFSLATYVIAFFFANPHSVYKSHKYNKTDRKENKCYPSQISWKVTVPPVSAVFIKLQINCKRSSRMEQTNSQKPKKLENFTYTGKYKH